MRIILSGVGFRTSQPLRVYAENRVLSWLGHLERELELVAVQLVSSSHAGGQRILCRLLARTVSGESLVVEEASANAHETIDRAPERMARALRRTTGKQRRPARAGV